MDEFADLKAARGEVVAERQAWYEQQIALAEDQWAATFLDRWECGDDVPSKEHYVALWLAERAAPEPAAVDGAEPIYYMRDNHTFKRLSDHVPTALIEIEAEFNAGYAHGMLCSKRPGFKDVHASGDKSRVEFLAACEESLTAALATNHQEPTT